MTNTGWAAFLTGLVTMLKGMGPALWDAAHFAAGIVFEIMRRAAADNGKVLDQYKEMLDEERKASARPKLGAAERLRQSGYTIDK